MEREKKGLEIPYGISNFEKMRRGNYLYVDKTHFIEELEKTQILIHLRPRRFGKSLLISVLEHYYDIAKADQFDELFEGLYIHDHPTKIRHQYYMLRFNFSGIQSVDETDLKSGFLNRVFKGIERFIKRYNFDIQMDEKKTIPASVLDDLLTAVEGLKLAHQVYILIDEYDHFTNPLLKGDAKDFLAILTQGGFVRAFYEVIKEKCELGIVDRFFATGVTSVSLDSMTSGFNVAMNITTDDAYADMVGFTSEEVRAILKQLIPLKREQAAVYEVLRQNYNGYLFSEETDIKVFNSTLIMYYLKHYVKRKRAPKALIDPNLNQSGMTIEHIVSLKTQEKNGEVVKRIVEGKQVLGELSTFIDIVKKFDENDFITMLFNIGLLTIKEPDVITVFEIPNKVTENVYLEYLANLMQERSHYRISVTKQKLALSELGKNGNIAPLTDLVVDFLTHTAVRNKRKFDEKYIKLVYMMLLATNNQFITYDEYPTGQGFIDLFIQKTPASYATYECAIELKHVKIGEATHVRIEKEFLAAKGQMDRYLDDKRISERPNLKKWIIIFSGFDVIKMEEI